MRKIVDKFYIDFDTTVHLSCKKLQCKKCGHIFVDNTSLLCAKENISIHLRLQVLEQCRTDKSLSMIADELNLSRQEVYNIFESNVHLKRHTLPEVLCLDEFKNLKTEDGSYAVVLYDPMNHIIIDIIEDRKLITLDKYFYDIPFEEKKNVKYFISDMYEGFRTVKKHFFPNATHVVDSFHYIRYIIDAVDKTRKKVMASYDEHTPEYRILKNNWRFPLIRIKDFKTYNLYNSLKKKKTSSNELLTDMLELNQELYEAYILKEDYYLMSDVIKYETADKELSELINKYSTSNNEEFKNLAKTLLNWKTEIINSFLRFGDKRLNNGYLEGMNNRIKQIKKFSYGFRKFYYMRDRLMFIINPNEPISKVDVTKIPRKPKHKN